MSDKVLWSGRFEQGASDSTLAFTSSLSIDRRLARFDVLESIAHAKMLTRQKIISLEDGKAIVEGLKDILNEIEAGSFQLRPQLEDIHSNLEIALTERLKEAGARLHTARSRNDQVATDLRLFLREANLELLAALVQFEMVLMNLASEHIDDIVPGFTHLQHAQPITLGHHLLAHFFRLQRDADRLMDSYKRINLNPLGSAALAGTTYNIDRLYTTQLLGFDSPLPNSLDAVSSRDVAAEFIFDLTTCMVHLSSICEELVIWSSPEFGFVEISDAYSTGSSIMPQKKNPDVAELIRGRTSGVIGNLLSMMVLMKGLPLAYNRDLQEDKTSLFSAYDTALSSLKIMAGMLETSQFNVERMRRVAGEGYINATDLADYLVVKGIPFRQAHEIVGKVVRYSIDHQKKIEDLSLAELKEFSGQIDQEVFEILPIQKCVERRRSIGGTSPEVIPMQLSQAYSTVKKQADFLEKERGRIERTWKALLSN